mmetsp:Transcript_35902/g.88342  ORF Transcript_35902/g.88342 Transcript_35902/m.88342 type:complete len:331 (-) Transcript_35902:301-1293(-)
MCLQNPVLLRQAVHPRHGIVLELLPVVVLAFVLRDGLGGLGLQVLDLILHLVDVHVQAVHVLEPVEVELLNLDEVRHKVLDLGEARGDLQLLEGLLKGQGLILEQVCHGLLLGKLPLALDNLLLQVLLLLCRHVTHVVGHVELPLAEPLLHRVEGAHDVLELAALRKELLLGSVGRVLELLDVRRILCPLLEPGLGLCDDLLDLLVDGLRAPLVAPHELLEALALASQLVDLVACLLVVGDLLGKALHRQVQIVAHPLHLLAQRRVGGVVGEVVLHRLDVVVGLLELAVGVGDLALLRLDPRREGLSLLCKPRHRRQRPHARFVLVEPRS